MGPQSPSTGQPSPFRAPPLPEHPRRPPALAVVAAPDPRHQFAPPLDPPHPPLDPNARRRGRRIRTWPRAAIRTGKEKAHAAAAHAAALLAPLPAHATCSHAGFASPRLSSRSPSCSRTASIAAGSSRATPSPRPPPERRKGPARRAGERGGRSRGEE